MPQVANTRKDFNYSIEIDGVDQFLIQKVTPPKKSLAVVEHGGDARSGNTKTPGRPKIGDLIVEKLVRSDRADTWADDWIETANGNLRGVYAKYAVLHEWNEQRTAPIASWDLAEIWPFDLDRGSYDRMSDGANIIEKVSFAVGRYTLRK